MAELSLVTQLAPSARRWATMLGPVLAGMSFPAERWRIVAHAAHWGLTPSLQAVLGRLAEPHYPTAQAVVVELGRSAQQSPRS